MRTGLQEYDNRMSIQSDDLACLWENHVEALVAAERLFTKTTRGDPRDPENVSGLCSLRDSISIWKTSMTVNLEKTQGLVGGKLFGYATSAIEKMKQEELTRLNHLSNLAQQTPLKPSTRIEILQYKPQFDESLDLFGRARAAMAESESITMFEYIQKDVCSRLESLQQEIVASCERNVSASVAEMTQLTHAQELSFREQFDRAAQKHYDEMGAVAKNVNRDLDQTHLQQDTFVQDIERLDSKLTVMENHIQNVVNNARNAESGMVTDIKNLREQTKKESREISMSMKNTLVSMEDTWKANQSDIQNLLQKESKILHSKLKSINKSLGGISNQQVSDSKIFDAQLIFIKKELQELFENQLVEKDKKFSNEMQLLEKTLQTEHSQLISTSIKTAIDATVENAVPVIVKDLLNPLENRIEILFQDDIPKGVELVFARLSVYETTARDVQNQYSTMLAQELESLRAQNQMFLNQLHQKILDHLKTQIDLVGDKNASLGVQVHQMTSNFKIAIGAVASVCEETKRNLISLESNSQSEQHALKDRINQACERDSKQDKEISEIWDAVSQMSLKITQLIE